jgi:hypothetical protein
MTNLVPLSETEVKELAAEWYNKLDVHAPMVEILPLLADEELEMVFPEATAHGHAGFEGWYQRVIRIFFDEVHTLKEVKLTSVSEEKAEVKVIVNWQASVWNPPAAKSERIKLDAYQTWVVKRSPQTQKPVIATYIVDLPFRYEEGSAKL